MQQISYTLVGAATSSECHLSPCRYAPRSIRFPRQADLSNIKASYDNGVLKLVIPKKQVSSLSGILETEFNHQGRGDQKRESTPAPAAAGASIADEKPAAAHLMAWYRRHPGVAVRHGTR
jgi:Hsp20/alpha crystallin family